MRYVRNQTLEEGSSILDALKLLPLQLLLHFKKQIEITRIIRGLGDKLNAICFQEVQSGDGGVGTCVVVGEQQAAGAVVWTECAPSLEDLGREASMYHSAVTVFLSWSGTEVTRPDLAKKTAVTWFEVLLDLLNFTGWALT